MLFKRDTLDAIVSGDVTLAFRRWTKPSVRTGTLLRTALGVVRITGIAVEAPGKVSRADAKRAGFGSRSDLMASMEGRDGTLYRIELAFEGADERVALRGKAPSSGEMDQVLQTLARMDAARSASWTKGVLSLIAEKPATRAADLAAALGRETKAFKADVRKLKELGLTESLDIGYRLSARGKAALRRL